MEGQSGLSPPKKKTKNNESSYLTPAQPNCQEGKKLREEILQHQKDMGSRDFAIAAVEGHRKRSILLEQTYVALGHNDFQKFFSRGHRVKDPKVPKVEVPGPYAASETLFLFKDANDPFRRLKVVTEISADLATQCMTHQQHLHADQSTHIFDMVAQQQLIDSGVQNLPVGGLSSMSTLEEYKQKLLGKVDTGKEKEVPAAQMPEQAGGRSSACEKDVYEVDDDDDEAVAPPMEPSSSAQPSMKTETHEVVKPKNLFPALAAAAKRPGKNSPGSKSSAGKIARSGSGSCLGEAGVVNDAASVTAASSIGGGVASEENEVSKHVAKLPLLKILSGEKYKLFLHHASEAKPKLSQQQQVQLGAHIKLVGHAAKLTPGMVGSVPMDELKESILALKDHIHAWPVETQVALFKKQMEEKVSLMRATVDEATFDAFWKAVRPYVLEESAEDSMDLLNLKLSDLSITVSAKCQRFKEHVFEDIILQEVLGGETKSARLVVLGKKFMEVIGAELQQDIAEDSYVAALFEMDVCLSALSALLAKDATTMLAYQEQVETMRGLTTSANMKSPCQVVALALLDVPWWSEKLASHQTLLKAMGIHQTKLQRTTEFLSSEVETPDPEYVQGLTAACRDLTTLQEELPSGCVKDLSASVLARLEKTWPFFKQHFGKDTKITLEHMNVLLQEGSICFPLEQGLPSAQEELASMMLSASAEKKLKSMLSQVQTLDVQKGLEQLDVEKELQPLLSLCREAKGVEMDAAQSTALGQVLAGLGKTVGRE